MTVDRVGLDPLSCFFGQYPSSVDNGMVFMRMHSYGTDSIGNEQAVSELAIADVSVIGKAVSLAAGVQLQHTQMDSDTNQRTRH